MFTACARWIRRVLPGEGTGQRRTVCGLTLLACVLGLVGPVRSAAAICAPGWLPGEGFPGVNLGVSALTVYNGELIAGGGFTTTGGVSASKIARWNSTAWQPLGTGMNSSVYALTVYNGELIAGGGSPRPAA